MESRLKGVLTQTTKKAIVGIDPRTALIDLYVQDITGSSIQGWKDLAKCRDALGITGSKLDDSDLKAHQDFFDARLLARWLEVLRKVGFYRVAWRVDARGADARDHIEKLDRELHEVCLGCPYLLTASRAVLAVLRDRKIDLAFVLRGKRALSTARICSRIGKSCADATGDAKAWNWPSAACQPSVVRSSPWRGFHVYSGITVACSSTSDQPTSHARRSAPANAEHGRQAARGSPGHNPMSAAGASGLEAAHRGHLGR